MDSTGVVLDSNSVGFTKIQFPGGVVHLLQLATMRHRLRLEIRGMRFSGRSTSAILKDLLGLPKSWKRERVLDTLERTISSIESELGIG